MVTMTSSADLFVVCKQCGSEVSPYVTECPYCGHRLRRRAPKLPRMQTAGATTRRRRGLGSVLGRLRPSRGGAGTRPAAAIRSSRWAATRPYATMVLVAAGAITWVVWHTRPSIYLHMAVFGPLKGDWWKLLTAQFAYMQGWYAFIALLAVALFGWLLEARHGPLVVLGLFFAAGVAGALAALAVYEFPWVAGANAGALALLAAWAAPDLREARTGGYYEGDLLGAGVMAALLLALPFALRPPEASWLAGVTGGVIGLLVGSGLHRLAQTEA